jgi:hypothetical protein
VNVLLGAVFFFLKMLISFDGSADVEGELLINYFVHCFSERGSAIKDSELIGHKGWTEVVHGDGLQDAVVIGVALTIGGLDFCFAILNSVGDEGGNDEAVGGGVRNENPVIRCGEGVI